MQNIEPFYNWRHLYTAEEDSRSPFYGIQYSEFEYSNTIYNYYIHPQWDYFGSKTMFIKLLFVDYEMGYAVIEMLGEWNDAIENDIMTLRRNITDPLQERGILKFIFISENVLNFHSSDDSYYEDWNETLSEMEGWVTLVNIPEQSKHDFKTTRLFKYLYFVDFVEWRTLPPDIVFQTIENIIFKKLGK